MYDQILDVKGDDTSLEEENVSWWNDISAISNMTLGILGPGVLAIPYALCKAGTLGGSLIFLVFPHSSPYLPETNKKIDAKHKIVGLDADERFYFRGITEGGALTSRHQQKL